MISLSVLTSMGPFAPFCLPQDGANVVVDATYYITWNADFYPLNASITIEMRYSNSTARDSAFTSEKNRQQLRVSSPLHAQGMALGEGAELFVTAPNRIEPCVGHTGEYSKRTDDRTSS